MPTNWLFEYYGQTGASTSNWIQLDTQIANVPTQLTTSYSLPTLYNGARFRFSLSNNNSPTADYLELKRIQIKNQLIVTALSIDQTSKALFATGVGIGTTTSTLVNQLGVNAETNFYKDVTFNDGILIRGVMEFAYEGDNNTSRGRKGHRGIEWRYDDNNRWGMVQDSLYNLALYTSSFIDYPTPGEGSSITFNKTNTVNNDATIAFTEYGRFNYQGNLGIGTTRPRAKLHVNSDASAKAMIINRTGNGTLIDFNVANISQGSISVSGATVSYNTFTGGHWTQLENNNGPIMDIPRGTVMSSIDQMAEWKSQEWYNQSNIFQHESYYGQCNVGDTFTDEIGLVHTVVLEENESLAKCKISDIYCDKRVYGVFSNWDHEGDMVIHSLGVSVVRVKGGCKGGDLIVSNGDGTAVSQADDIIRSYTIGKITVGNSNLDEQIIPCVLYCG